MSAFQNEMTFLLREPGNHCRCSHSLSRVLIVLFIRPRNFHKEQFGRYIAFYTSMDQHNQKYIQGSCLFSYLYLCVAIYRYAGCNNKIIVEQGKIIPASHLQGILDTSPPLLPCPRRCLGCPLLIVSVDRTSLPLFCFLLFILKDLFLRRDPSHSFLTAT